MDAIEHRETRSQMRFMKGAAVGAVLGAAGVGAAKVMSVVAHPEILAQAKVIRYGGGIAVYAAHIRQVDQGRLAPVASRASLAGQRDHFGRDR